MSKELIIVDEYEPAVDIADYPFDKIKEVQIHRDRWVTDEYDISDFLGRGKFGEVKRCRDKYGGKEFAAKFLSVPKPQDVICVENEISIMKKLHHRRLLQLYDAFSFQGEMCLVLEIVLGGELFDRVIDEEFILTEKCCVCIMRQICEGVRYMHSRNILHLDLKPENIMCISKTGNRIKIIDFGLARVFDPAKDLRVLFGTPEFMAPEVVQYDAISSATDMWSIGVIGYVLLSGLSPFMGDNDGDTLINVTKVDYDFDYDEFSEISESAKDFIEKLLLLDKRKRMSADECLNHPWLKKPEKRPHGSELSKERLRHYVYRRKWQKAVHAIIALHRMGYQLGTFNNPRPGMNVTKRERDTKLEDNSKELEPKSRTNKQAQNVSPKIGDSKQTVNTSKHKEASENSFIRKSGFTPPSTKNTMNYSPRDKVPTKDAHPRALLSDSGVKTPKAKESGKTLPPPWKKRQQKLDVNETPQKNVITKQSAEKDLDVCAGRNDEPKTKEVPQRLTWKPPKPVPVSQTTFVKYSAAKRSTQGAGDNKNEIVGNRRSWQKLQNTNNLAKVRTKFTEDEGTDLEETVRSPEKPPSRDRSGDAQSVVKQMQRRLQAPKMFWSRVDENSNPSSVSETFKVPRQNIGKLKDNLVAFERLVGDGGSPPGSTTRDVENNYSQPTPSPDAKSSDTESGPSPQPVTAKRQWKRPTDNDSDDSKAMQTGKYERKFNATATAGTTNDDRVNNNTIQPTTIGSKRLADLKNEPNKTTPPDGNNEAPASLLRRPGKTKTNQPKEFKPSQRGMVRANGKERRSTHNPSASFKRRSARSSKDINAASDETYVRLGNVEQLPEEQEQTTASASREYAFDEPRDEPVVAGGTKVVNRVQAAIQRLTSSKDSARTKRSRPEADKHKNMDDIEFAIKDLHVKKTNLYNQQNSFAMDTNEHN